MSPDVVLIADSGIDSFSGSNPLRLRLEGHTATVQAARNFLANDGCIVHPILGDGIASWESAPKLNGLQLFSYLLQQGFRAALINNFHQEELRFRDIAAQNPLIVAVSTTFMVHRKTIIDLVSQIKNLCPSATVIVGGPFVSTSWRILQRKSEPLYNTPDIHRDFLFHDATGDQTDLYIVSDLGEELLADAIRCVKAGGDLASIPNSARVQDGQYLFGRRIDDIGSHSETPINWAGLPDEVFASGVVPMRASVGCPYRCSFCNFNKDPRLTYVKPLDLLIGELQAVQKRGARYVWFVDDNFRLGKHDLETVCKRLIEEKISLLWMSLIRAEALEDVAPDLLKRAGCRELQMGIESADPGILQAMNKRSDPALNERVIRRLLEAGINCSCYFVIGFPGETDDTVATTIEFIKRLEAVDGPGIFSWSFYPFLLVPFSPVFEEAHRSRHLLSGHMQSWQHGTMDSETARRHLMKAFLEFNNSSPIYRGDNLDQLAALGPAKAKQFMAVRHRLEKNNIRGTLGTAAILNAFRDVFRPE